jgi:hypothetical protein
VAGRRASRRRGGWKAGEAATTRAPLACSSQSTPSARRSLQWRCRCGHCWQPRPCAAVAARSARNGPAAVGAAAVFRGRRRDRRVGNFSGRRQRSLQGEVAGQSAAGHSVSAREGDYAYYVHDSMTPCRACTPRLIPSTVLAYPAGNNPSTFHERIVKAWGKDP